MSAHLYRDVDFVVGGPPGTDEDSAARWADVVADGTEEYAAGPRWGLPGTAGTRQAVAVVVTVLAVATVLLTNRVKDGKDAVPPVVAVHSAPAPVVTTEVAQAEPTTPQLLHVLLGGPPCPWADDGQSYCATNFVLPPDALGAVRLYFPGVRAVRSVTHVLRDTGPGSAHGLWTRSISARLGSMRLTVTVRTDESAPLGGGLMMMDGRRYAYCEQRLGKYLLAVVLTSDESDATAFSGRVASDRVSALAGDERLTQL